MKPHRIARATAFALALALAALVAVLGGVSFERKVASFETLGFSGEPRGGGIEVTRVSDASTGLIVGDHILDADGTTTNRFAELAEILRGSDKTTLFLGRGDAFTSVEYQRPKVDIDFPYLILALVGAAFLLIGLYTLVKDRRRGTVLFYLWCMSAAALFLITPGSLSTRPDATTRLLFYVDQVARLLLPPLMVHLFLVFPDVLGRFRKLARWSPFLYLPAAAFLLLRLDLWFNAGTFLLGGATQAKVLLLDRVENAHLAVFSLAAVAILTARMLREKDWERARQVRWIVLGLGVGVLPFALFNLAPRVLGAAPSETTLSLTLLPLLAVPVTFAWAILRYKLFDIEVIVRDTISATLTVLLGIIGFSLVNLTIDRGLPADFDGARNLVSFASGLAIAGLLLPTRRGIAAGLERVQYRGSFGKRRALTDFGDELAHEHDLSRLCERLLERLEDGVEVERANLYLGLGDSLLLARPEPRMPESLSPDALGETFWETDVRRLSGVALPSAEQPPEQTLFAAGYRHAFPVSLRGTPIALVVTSYRLDEAPLTSDDVDLVRQLLGQAALAIENAQLLDQLKVRLDEVSELQRYNEGIIESSPAGIVVLDADDAVVSANAAFGELVESDRSALAGRALRELLPIAQLPAPGEPVAELSFCDTEGHERHLQISTSSFPLGESRKLRIVVVHDVSERAAMEEALKEKDRLAALGALAAGVAHEVNTPITGISSYAQMLLADTDSDDPRYEILKKVERQTFRATQIVNSLLEFARQRENERAPVALSELVGECLDLIKPRLTKRRVRVAWQPPAEEIAVLGNAGELQQVVTNLLVNGSDAMAETGGDLTVELSRNGTRAYLSVADTGPGIPAERVQKIFEPFFTTKLGSGGTGLGLSISYEIVQRHEGDLRVASEPGKGSCFTVELPILTSASAEVTAG